MLQLLLRKIRYNLLFYYYRYRVPERILFDGVSPYSHIRVIQQGNKLQMCFVKEGREEYNQSDMDVLDPLHLSMEYTRLMFAAFFFIPDLTRVNRVLMVGLGGGVFCPLIKEYLPRATLDIVEIDAMVVSLARSFFNFRESQNINLYIEDIQEYIKKTRECYDLILSDPFLLNYVPLHLRTLEYYRKIKRILKDNGVFSRNIVTKARFFSEEIKAVTSLFPSTYFFEGKDDNSAMVICNSPYAKYYKDDIFKAARNLEKRYRFSLPLTDLALCYRESMAQMNGEILTDDIVTEFKCRS
jgi:spermidine synthase